ncbi:DUF4232 domain-containing protein [Streptomyces sp. NPDC050145]|uniref:DUF4232 domain-containing protein n=1 Tax=Streptomyces sp. NPDC050145 TaxID=3365602 RepID=UPI003799644B
MTLRPRAAALAAATLLLAGCDSAAPPDTIEVAPSTRPCPDSGIRLTTGPTEAASGLRALRVTLTNCGRTTVELNGYPRLTLLDADREPVEHVTVLEGTDEITTGIRDDGPRRITVRPRAGAVTSLVWRNTYDDTSRAPVTAPHVTVDPGLGRGTTTLTPYAPFDLGSTGKLGTTAWRSP